VAAWKDGGVARLVEETFATGGTAETWDSVVAVPFALEFVVVGELFI
jgi:hypothetical protein